MKIYLVGGAVRDQLLGLPIVERDWVVVGSSAEEMLAKGFQPVGKDFPVFLHPETKEEYALARTERKISGGYKGFTCFASPEVTLEEDLKRRDLTINAIAMDEKGAIIDPYGGVADLENQMLRHISLAFTEDPVRILRIARFQARFGFKIAAETAQLMRQMVREGEMHHLVPERVWNECVRALSEKTPAAFFKTLRDCGALRILMPELDALFGVPNPPRWHPEIDSGWHTYAVLEQAARLSSSPIVRFAALVHDLGKACSPVTQWPRHAGHEEAGVKQIQALARRLKIPKDYETLGILTARFHSLVHKCDELKPTTLLELFEKTDAFRRPERFHQLLLTCVADARGRPGHETDAYPQEKFLTHLLQSVSHISVQPFLEKGITGPAIAKALREARIERIKMLRGLDQAT